MWNSTVSDKRNLNHTNTAEHSLLALMTPARLCISAQQCLFFTQVMGTEFSYVPSKTQMENPNGDAKLSNSTPQRKTLSDRLRKQNLPNQEMQEGPG